MKKGKKRILQLAGQTSLGFDKEKELEFVDAFMSCLDSFYLVGPELLLGKLFYEIKQIIEQYNELWAIEKTFRISK